jgi:hypothetical protein
VEQRQLQVGLFSKTDAGVRLLGHTSKPDIVTSVQECIAAERRRELAELEPPIRLVTSTPEGAGE